MKNLLRFVSMRAARVYSWLAFGVGIEAVSITQHSIAPALGFGALFGALTLPGLLIVLLLRLKNITRLKLALYSSTLSILFVMLTGLGANSILPKFGYIEPLHLEAFGPWFIGCLMVLLAVTALINRAQYYVFEVPRLTGTVFAQIIGLGIIPLLAALGARSLNNGGTNSFTMIAFGLIAGWAVGLVILQKRISDWVWPWAIFTMGLAILWSTSLRGSFITGHDIQLEYYVFRLTDVPGFWSMSHLQDAYNACLSITIMPTVLKALSGFDAITQYKVIYQVLFALYATGVYVFSVKYAHRVLAFIAAFIFISFPTFLVDMPMLIRQEIAFGFYIILLISLFEHEQTTLQRRSLFTLFATGMVLSHYSTTFVASGILFGTYVLLIPRILVLKRQLQSRRHASADRAVTIGVLLVMSVMTFLWIGLYTKTGSNLSAQVTTIANNLPNLIHSSPSSETSAYTLFKKVTPTKQDYLNLYVSQQHALAQLKLQPTDTLYLDASRYPLKAVTEPVLPITRLGIWIGHYGISPIKLNAAAKTIYALSIQALIIFGITLMWLKRKNFNVPLDLMVIAPVGVGFLALQAVMPMVEYGLFRMLQQDLVFLALPIVWGALQLLAWVRIRSKRFAQSIVMSLLALAFLFLSGFIPQLVGGAVGQLSLNNSGFYYDAYFTSKADTALFTWLDAHYQRGYPIKSDMFLRMKIMANTGITTEDNLTPGGISKQSYVVLANQNVTAERVAHYYTGGALIFYQYPTNFLDNDKNLLYSNSETKVYH